ncbi:hypothetical protein HYE68_010847 [Fusarium pseudograminearum]|nr:hypothetical protein HYE68_010847 [Fusarium pseudograminearum]
MREESIADSVRNCLNDFEVIRKADLLDAGTANRNAALEIREEEARFKIWSGNIGAHSEGRRSLQYRLRDASHLQRQVMSLLGELSELLGDAFLIMSGEKIPWDRVEDDEDIPQDIESESDSEFGNMPETEAAQISQNVSDVVNCLLRLSVAIRNPAPHDRFMTFSSSEASHYEPFDIQHVKNKFSDVEPFLADRLGKAISRRREYFKYRESHHLKLKQGLDSVEEDGAESTVASSLPLHAKAAGFNLDAMDEDGASNSGFTQTSFASSRADSDKLSVPPLPKEAEDGPFECPFCYMMITASSTDSWKRHVLADLRPYVCLWEDCTASGMEFTRRYEWMLHEMQNHRKTYNCPCSCGMTFRVRPQCRDHINKAHSKAFPTSQLDTMIDLNAKPMNEKESSICPLCQENLSSMEDYQRHVGRHQEQLALFALPSLPTDDDEQIEDNVSGPHTYASFEDLNVPYGQTKEENPPESPVPTKPTSGPIKEMEDLHVEYRTKWLPLCSELLRSPSSDTKKRKEDCRKLSEDIINHVLLKIDTIETAGIPEARARRKEIVREVQNKLTDLDAVIDS